MVKGDTIGAIATAPGPAGIGIIRLSGDKSLEIGRKIFVSKTGKHLGDSPRLLCYGHIFEEETLVDEVLCCFMPKPHTYTGEDVLEIHCHGGYISVEKILSLVLKKGARLAEPGEFTKLAFLNGRIDLSQAESVMDVINAKSEKSYNVAQKQLSGSLSGQIKTIRDGITADLAEITVALDFPEEDIEEITTDKLRLRLRETVDAVDKLIKSFETGRILREGLKTVIVGKPNVGKSSLLNGMLEENRAIVTNVPGTTRDVIRESYSLSGIPLTLVDTAGIRETQDVVEQIGVKKSLALIEEADLIMVMLDSSRAFEDEDRLILEETKDKKRIVLINKLDLEALWKPEDEKIGEYVSLSAATGQGLQELKHLIKTMVYEGELEDENHSMITNIRHKDALVKAKEACEDARAALDMNVTLDLLETDYVRIWEALGEITGDTVTENLLDTIFANFCIGK
ncbi:MAG: tRNA uridine-5-carboxymethylaminomethyl(34) synthesis GTPase MnmE [Filifactoraceae bacterium]